MRRELLGTFRRARRPWIGLVVCVVAFIVLGSSCSQGDELASTEPTGGDSPTAVLPPVLRLPEELVPEELPLVTVQGELESYQIQMPAGWQTEDLRLPGGFLRRYIYKDGPNALVQFVVRCTVGAPVEGLIAQDYRLISSLGGRYRPESAVDVGLGPLTAKLVDYDLASGGLLVEQRAYYLYSEPCGWRLVLQSFVPGGRERFAALFDKVVQTFEPRRFDVPFTDRDPYIW